MSKYLFLIVSILAFVQTLTAAAPHPETKWEVVPSSIHFFQAGRPHRLLVSQMYPDGSQADRTAKAQFTVEAPQLVQVDANGLVIPMGVGTTSIRVRLGNQAKTVAVHIKSVEPAPVSFVNDVMPILSRTGCNSGACHGSASGKKGFKVSLRGYDPATDFLTLTRGQGSRRIDLLQPDQSLLVLKPTGQALHEGGKRFDRTSDFAHTLTRWIAKGANSDVGKAPRPTKLEIYPSFATYRQPGQSQQLLVRATYSDGQVRDVTHLARYSSSNESVVSITEEGHAKLVEKGEAAIMARLDPLIAVSNLVVLRHDESFQWKAPPENNAIDHLVFKKLKAMQILPSELTGDGEFLRRISYDVIGLPPTPTEIRAFLADPSTNKREKKIEELLNRPEFAEFWASKWVDLFRLRFDLSGDKGTWGMYRFLRDSIAADKPFDQMTREILTAGGSTREVAPATYWRIFNNSEEATEATAQIFLGVRLMCARCHDHPFEKWVQNDYYGLAAFFNQVGRKPGSRQNEQIIFRQKVNASARHPVSGATLDPKFLGGDSIKVSADEDARSKLAAWMTAKENPYFARATVNRVWSHLFGRGIIDPVDDIRSSNPPTNPALLDALTQDFVEHKFSLRHLLRNILRSRTYQLSAHTNSTNAEDRSNFSHALPRRLSAEQLVDSLGVITGIRENYRSRTGAGTVALPAGGVRASQLPDRSMTSELLDLFGRPRGESTCSCERSDEASLTHALQLINNTTIAQRINSPAGNLAKLLNTPKQTNAGLVEELFLLVVGRFPGEKEKALVIQHLEKSKNRTEAAQDLVWTLVNSRAFLFNH